MKVIPTCNCDNPTKEYIVDLPGEFEHNVVGREDGSITDRWDDGTVGIPDEVIKIAEDSETWICPICFAECDFDHTDEKDMADPYEIGLCSGCNNRRYLVSCPNENCKDKLCQDCLDNDIHACEPDISVL